MYPLIQATTLTIHLYFISRVRVYLCSSLLSVARQRTRQSTPITIEYTTVIVDIVVVALHQCLDQVAITSAHAYPQRKQSFLW